MDYQMMFVGLGIFVVGFLFGKASKGGLNLNVNMKDQSIQATEKEEYNESMVDLLDPDVRNYYENTNGQNKF